MHLNRIRKSLKFVGFIITNLMKRTILFSLLLASSLSLTVLAAANKQPNKDTETSGSSTATDPDLEYTAERFADIKLIRYRVPGFEQLDPKKKELLYYLYEAALSGRDIIYDQNYRHNLQLRKLFELIASQGTVSADGEDLSANQEYKNLMTYIKRFWFSNGVHHHYSNTKFEPTFGMEFFQDMVRGLDEDQLPLKEGQHPEEMIMELSEVIFNNGSDYKKVDKSSGVDLVAASAVNFYGEDLTQKEVEAYYASLPKEEGNQPEYGLNTKLVKEGGAVKAKTWKVGGMYSPAIEKIVYWLEKATTVAENAQQREALQKLIAYYKSGDVKDWDQYNIAWVNDTESRVDVVNGFIEVYNDPLGYKGSFESVVSFKDLEATQRIEKISREAQWFEDVSPIMAEHKKANVKGITGKVITVVVESGDASPSTPIGINLPNSNWIRQKHGSKSVSLGNIVHAYEMSAKEGRSSLGEFAISDEAVMRARKYGSLADILHTDLHEVIGHASGKVNEGVGTTKETLKNYASTLEEGRADLVALYFLFDQKLVDLELMPSLEVGMVAYDDYIMNGMMLQLKRLKPGEQIEEDHMRNRQMIAKWAFEIGQDDSVIVKKVIDDRTYFVIQDYQKLKDIFGFQLRELQRIKSEGDFEAGQILVEKYGVKVDPELHQEVLDRYAALDIAPYGGFINPILKPVMEGNRIVDVKIEYSQDFTEQMLYYGNNYSFLPVE